MAIKCLHLPDTLNPALTRPVVEAFEDAGRLHDRLGRDNLPVAQTIAAGVTIAPRTGSRVPYRVREWFEGESLASDLARRRHQGDKPRTVEEAFALLAPAIDGIAHAHEEGIAHLSLDPGNLFLARDEGPCSLKVLDFGTARARHRADVRPTLDSELTRGLHLLRPAYAAPEQLDMELGEPGTWTDVYSLALITMEVLAQRSDVEGRDTAALVERALDRQKRPTPQAHGLRLPRTLDLALTRAVARSPEGRQKDARVFLNELKAAVKQGVPAKTRSPRAAPGFAAPPAPSKPLQPPAPKPAPGAPRVPAIACAPAALIAPPPPTPQFEASALPPSAAVSSEVVAAPGPEDPPIAPVASPPSLFAPLVNPNPSLVDLEEKLVRRRSSSRALWLGASAAALAFVSIVAALFALSRARRPSETLAGPLAPIAPSAVVAVARPAVAPVASPAAVPVAPFAVAAVAPAVAAPRAAVAVASAARAASPHAAIGLSIPRFSRAAAQRAVNAATRRVARCRHGRFWGNGYATVGFTSDGSVDQVLVDPPFSMTVTGKCVADALGAAHMRSFAGRNGYYRFRFYIAPR